MAVVDKELRRPDPEVAAEALEPEAGLLADADPAGFADALGELGSALVRDPVAYSSAALRLGTDLAMAGASVALRSVGLPAPPRLAPERRDRRFKDPAWSRQPGWFALQQAYLLWSRSALELVEAAKLDGPERMKAEFAVRAIVDALAPTNYLAGNPTALRRAFETGGLSVLGRPAQHGAATWSATAAARARSTCRPSRWARTSRRRRGRSCTATS